MKIKPLFTLALLVFAVSTLCAQEVRKSLFSPSDIDIPYEKFVLDNGLTLIVHEDPKAPIAAVNVWYHVGSKNEKPGKSGFAHLFEHLMFNGSENFNDDYFQALERIGGTDLNGTTNVDRTNYFQNVPVAALDQVLWLESDRMGHLLGAIDQAKLDEQRGVVQNEKRQGENQPYGRQWEMFTKALYPYGHPYSWTTIGEMEHLNAASLDDVHEWFKQYYGAANAVVVVAGAVTADDVHEKVKKYFGSIPAGPTLSRWENNVPVRTTDTRESFEDRVPEARVAMGWNTPEMNDKEHAYLDLATSVLSSGKNSRLYKKLVYEDQIASNAYAFIWEKEIAGNVYIQSNVKPGISVEEVEAGINAVLNDFIKNGPTEQEMERVKAEYFAGFIKGLERIGGFGGKSDVLASSMVYRDSPDGYKTYLNNIHRATKEDVRKAAEKWLSRGRHTIVVTPFPDFQHSDIDADRSSVPELSAPTAASFPTLQETTLSNGLKVVLAPRPGVPTVELDLSIDAGYAADQYARPGTATLAMNMMDEGTKNKSALEINEELQFLGASLNTYASLDNSMVSMSTLKPTMGASLDLLADVVLNPAFPEADFDRLKKDQMNNIKREKSSPFQMALRVLPTVMYGEGHAYSIPFTGSGYEETVDAISRKDVVKYYEDWVRPNNATLVVVGDVTMAELKPMLEKKFGGWNKADVPKKNLAAVPSSKGGTLYLLDRPESKQSVIMAGYLVAPYGETDEMSLQVMNDVFGGDFTSRMNMNLREDKHWSYGARNIIYGAKGQRPLFTYAPVQTDKTKESIQEIKKEFNMVVGDKPITKEEFEKVQKNTVLQLPGKWETNSAVSSSLLQMVKYDLPNDYYQNYDREMRNLKLTSVQQSAKDLLQPDQLNFFVVGDREKVIEGLKDLDFSQIILVDPDGKELERIKGNSKP